MQSVIQKFRYAAFAAGLFISLITLPPLDAQGSGSIAGVVTASARTLQPVRVTIDQRVCGNELPDESILVNASGGVANAVVTLSGVKSRALPASAAVMNDKCRFSPRVQIARPNATVATSSVDPILHTTNAQIGSRTMFNVALPVPGIKINRPLNGAGIVRLSCNTHPWMRGWIVLTDELAVVTGSDGRFTLADVPPGTYELRVWHEALKSSVQKVTVSAGQTATMTIGLH
jgi:hypothetical protein